MRARDVMTKPVIWISPKALALEANQECAAVLE
jgi:hypothetical protein